MRTVSNTSPLSNLAVIGRLDLVREQFGTVQIPSTVAGELARLSHAAGQALLVKAMAEGWLVETRLPGRVIAPPEASHLDAGERAAITLALTLAPDGVRLLIDEKEGREAAAKLGIKMTGVIGILITAKRQSRIPLLAEEIERLRTEARFFIHPMLEKRALELAGE